LDGKVLAEQPLLVLQDVPEAGFFGRMADKVRLMFE
jgi:D-alanyl-D-alanine carboxypeptidase (penicillin-binding protein 5/6)